MLVSLDHKFVFLCNPKSATSSSEKMLKPFSDVLCLNVSPIRHTNFRVYKKYVKNYIQELTGIDDLETICVIREPVSWLNSWYRFRSRYELRNSNILREYSTAGIEFTDFLKAYMTESPPPYANVGNQFDFVKNDANKNGVDRLFSYDDINQFVKYMSKLVGKRLKMGSINISPKSTHSANYRSYISAIKRKLYNRMNLPYAVVSSGVSKQDLPDSLIQSLKDFIPEDFKLYDLAKDGNRDRL